MTPPQPMPRGADALNARPLDAFASATQDDDMAIGFECAHPMLQIERWGMPDEEAQASHAGY